MTRRLVACLVLAAALWAGSADAAGTIWAMKAGDVVATAFGGTTAGRDSAYTYCGSSGFVQMGPGLEALALGSPPAGVTVTRATKNGWEVHGTGITTPRFGPASTPTAGGALRIVDGVTFPLTVAGVQAALNELQTVGGGECWVPVNANILLATTSIKIPNFCKLKGQVSFSGGGYTFTSNGSTNVSAAIVNADTSGAQEYAAVENINIYGGASGARIDAGIKMKKVFVGSYIRECFVTQVSGISFRVEGDNTTSAGQLYMDGCVSTNSGSYGYYLNSSLRSIWMDYCTAERPGRNTAGVYVNGSTTTSGANIGVGIDHFYTEISDSMSSGIIVNGASNVNVNNYTASVPSGRMRSAVRVQNTNNGVNTFSPSGVTVDGLYAASDTLVEDLVTGRAITTGYDPAANPYAFLIHWNATDAEGTVSTNGLQNSGQIVGIQPARLGPDLASAATITPLPNGGDFFTVTGVTPINDVAFNDSFIGKYVTFRFTGADTVNVAGHWKINGPFYGDATGTEDDLTGFVDSAKNFKETGRSFH